MGPTVYSRHSRRLEGRLTICGCDYKGSAFCFVILRPWESIPHGSLILNQLSHLYAVTQHKGLSDKCAHEHDDDDDDDDDEH